MATITNKQFFKSVPKLELHSHLNGSLSLETLQKLRKLNNSSNDVETWPESFSNLSSCFQLFSIAHNQTTTAEAVKLATICTIQEFAEDGVIYLELRSTPRKDEKMTKRQYLQAIINGVLEAREIAPSIEVTIIVSINRDKPVEEAEENVQLALEFAASYPETLVGVDLSGNPSCGKFNDFVSALSQARKGGLKITLHCAEIENHDEVNEMLDFKPDRIGHFTVPSIEAVTKLREMKIPIELCVTSNIKCETVARPEDHHFRMYYQQHPVILGTDDKGVFNTSLSEEYSLVQSAFHLDRNFFWKMNYDAVDFTFATSETKATLREILKKWKTENLC